MAEEGNIPELTAAQVVQAVAASPELEGVELLQLEIKQGTPQHYVCRLWGVSEEDYIAIHVRYEDVTGISG